MKELTCIICPNGCTLQIEEAGEGWNISGNLCQRGADFAVEEMTSPVRTICSTAATIFPETPVIPVRVSEDIPKEKIFEVMEEINKLVVTERVSRGKVLIHNVLGLKADIIVSGSALSEQAEGEDNYE